MADLSLTRSYRHVSCPLDLEFATSAILVIL